MKAGMVHLKEKSVLRAFIMYVFSLTAAMILGSLLLKLFTDRLLCTENYNRIQISLISFIPLIFAFPVQTGNEC